MQVTGKVKWIDQGSGTWGLEGNDGKTYELYGSKAEEMSAMEGKQVSVQGDVRQDIMTMAMVGPVLEVKSYKPLD